MSRARSFVRPSAICAGLVVVTSVLSGCFGQAQPAAAPATPIPPAASPVASPAASPVIVPASSPQPSGQSAGPGQTHTVAEGDTLASIAQQYYEDSAEWRRIYDANKDAIGENPDAIKIGQTLRIPPKE